MQRRSLKPAQLLTLLALLANTAPPATAQEVRYPVARESDQADVYHGVRIADPYRWLEDTDSPETRQWITAQNALTQSWLAAVPERDAIKRRLTELWDFPQYGTPRKAGGKYFQTENSGLQNQAVLHVRDGRDGQQRVLLDPNLLSSDGTVALAEWQPSPDGKRLAYSIATGGSDWREVRVRDVASGRDLSDTLRWIKFSDMSWTRDNRGFLYSRYEPDTGNALTRVVKQHRLFYHRLGTQQSRDLLIYERPDRPDWLLAGTVTDDGRYLVITVSEGTETRSRLYFIEFANPRKPRLDNPLVRLLDRFDAEYQFIGNVGHTFLVKTDRDAPRGRIVAIDINNELESAWHTVVPQTNDAMERAALIGDRLVVSFLTDAHSTIRIYAPSPRLGIAEAAERGPRGGGGPPARRSGDPAIDRGTIDRLFARPAYTMLREIALPTLGTVSGISGQADDPEMFYGFASFLSPLAIYRYDVVKGNGAPYRTPLLRFDPSLYETRQVFYTSKDGTRVPMFITARKGLVLDGNNPTLLYGYGGFNLPQTPGFAVRNLAWLELGGIYASANLRGGSEYGRAWHDAGRLAKKQNVFDDFVAAAEYLIRERYTSTPKLAIYGRSNGGLLVGAVLNQRPDLFGAALPTVGVMDMLRFHKFTIGWAWTSDYGSADDSTQFRTLRAYSPLHNIRTGVRYPPTMIFTADHDDRVVPGHSFKYAATLQAAQAGRAPILARIETEAGHGGAGGPQASVRKQIEEAADRLAFLVRALGMHPTVAR